MKKAMMVVVIIGVVAVMAAVGGLVFILYKIGEEMTMFRCGNWQQDRDFI